MNTFSLHSLWSERIGGSSFGKTQNIYKFQKIKEAKQKAFIANPNKQLLDFGIGEPNAMPPKAVREKLYASTAPLPHHAYADNGCDLFKDTVSQHMQMSFGVKLAPETEIVHCIGAKSALAMLPLCFINPGDIILTTSPGYPIAATHAQYLGGLIHELPLLKKNQYLPDFSLIKEETLKKTKILVLNYPNNPTGATASESFFKEAITLAKKYNFIIIQDAAYSLLSKEGAKSILSIPGAKDVAVEVHSLSKSHNMTGWRIGWVCGNKQIIKAFSAIKDNSDSGQFIPIQIAGALALEDAKFTEELLNKYTRRFKKLYNVLKSLGWKAEPPKATFFLYVPIPKSATNKETGETIKFNNAEELSQWLILKHSICTVPWDNHESAIRFSVTYPAQDEQKENSIMEILLERLSPYQFTT